MVKKKLRTFKCPDCGHLQTSTAKTGLKCKNCGKRYHVNPQVVVTQPEEVEEQQKPPGLLNFDDMLDFSRKKTVKAQEEEEEGPTPEETLLKTGVEMATGDLSSYFGALAQLVIESLTAEDMTKVSWDTRGKVISETLNVCGAMFAIAPPDPENRIEVPPIALVLISAGAIAAPFIIQYFKKKKKDKKKKEAENDEKNRG